MPTDQGSLLSIGASSWVLALTHYQTVSIASIWHRVPSWFIFTFSRAGNTLSMLLLIGDIVLHPAFVEAHRLSTVIAQVHLDRRTTRPTPTPTATTTVRVTLRRGQLQSRRALVMNPDGDDSFGRLPIRAEWLHCLEILDALGTYWKPPASLDVATIKH